MPQPSGKRNGRKFATKLDGCDAVGVEQHLVARPRRPRGTTRPRRASRARRAARARALAREQRGGDRLRRVQRGHLVGRGLVQEQRLARLGVGLVRGEAAVRLDHGVVGALVARTGRSGRSPTATRRRRGRSRRARRRSRGRAGPSRRAGSSGRPRRRRAASCSTMSRPSRLVHVDRDRALPAVAHRAQRAHPVDRHADAAADVADARPLDLDHRRALVGEQRDRVRPGERDRQVEDLDAGERERVASCGELRVACAAGRRDRCTRGRSRARSRTRDRASARVAASHASMSRSSAA